MLSYSEDQTYTLQDLRQWAFNGRSLAVVGHPVRHSISPQMHNAAIAHLARQHPELEHWKYFRFDIEADCLKDALPLFHEKRFFGLNLTVPHKEVAFSLLDSIDPAARRIGAVNTLKRDGQGYTGFNTDGYGLSQALRNDLGVNISACHILLLGAGGAARAAAVQCLEENCLSLTILNRSQERLQALLNALSPLAESLEVPLAGARPDDPPVVTKDVVVVNATSLGLREDDPSPWPPSALEPPARCYDMIYNPAVTPLMRKVSEAGGQSANGLSMLIHQGARSLEIWTGRKAPVEIMREAAMKSLPS